MNVFDLQKNALKHYFFVRRKTNTQMSLLLQDFRELNSLFSWEKKAVKSLQKTESKEHVTAEIFNLFLHWVTRKYFTMQFLCLKFTKLSLVFTDSGEQIKYLDIAKRVEEEYKHGPFVDLVRYILSSIYSFLSAPTSTTIFKELYYEEIINKLV